MNGEKNENDVFDPIEDVSDEFIEEYYRRAGRTDPANPYAPPVAGDQIPYDAKLARWLCRRKPLVWYEETARMLDRAERFQLLGCLYYFLAFVVMFAPLFFCSNAIIHSTMSDRTVFLLMILYPLAVVLLTRLARRPIHKCRKRLEERFGGNWNAAWENISRARELFQRKCGLAGLSVRWKFGWKK